MEPGTRVKIKPNGSKVAPGSVGTVAYLHPETGRPVVAVGQMRRPVAFNFGEIEALAIPGAPQSGAHAWSDVFDPREDYVSFVRHGLSIPAFTAAKLNADQVVVLFDRARGAIGIRPCDPDTPSRITLDRCPAGGVRLVSTALARLLYPHNGRGVQPRKNAEWDAATRTLIVPGVEIVTREA